MSVTAKYVQLYPLKRVPILDQKWIRCRYSKAAIGKVQVLLSIIPTIIPKIPSADAKISTIKIFTNREESWASAIAQLDPAIPTDTPDAMLVRPTDRPAE